MASEGFTKGPRKYLSPAAPVPLLEYHPEDFTKGPRQTQGELISASGVYSLKFVRPLMSFDEIYGFTGSKSPELASFAFRTTRSGALYSDAANATSVDVIATDVCMPDLLRQAYQDEMKFNNNEIDMDNHLTINSRPSSPLLSGGEEKVDSKASNTIKYDEVPMTGEERRKLRNKIRRQNSRINKALNRQIGNLTRKKSTAAVHKRAEKVLGGFNVSELKRCERGSWLGARSTSTKDSIWKIDELLSQGFRLFAWKGAPTVITDVNDRICAVLAGAPNASDWDQVQADVVRVLDEVREDGIAGGAFEDDELHHRRGDFAVLSCGVSYGGGGQKPGNLVQRKQIGRRLIQRLRANRAIQRIAGFQSAAFGIFAPKLYKHYSVVLSELFKKNPGLEENFENSIFPASSFNCGPHTVCRDHKDFANLSHGLCAITPFGSYDPTTGGHIIFFEMKLIVEFPPGHTAIIPSGAVTHGNTPICQGETRYSIAQYAAGGLFRWVAYGHKPVKGVSEEIRKKVDGVDGERWTAGIEMFSKLDELSKDYSDVFKVDV